MSREFREGRNCGVIKSQEYFLQKGSVLLRPGENKNIPRGNNMSIWAKGKGEHSVFLKLDLSYYLLDLSL